jgi:adenylate kinase family enzyme
MNSFPYRRIVVIGATSSGKSTLAKNLADKLSLDFIELDALHWEANWQEAEHEIFRARVDKATQAKGWALAGNYKNVRDIVWPRAEAVIWLDYSLWTIFRQLTRRAFKRWWTHELLWETNYENLWTHFKLWSDDSLYHWLFKTYWRRKKEIPLHITAGNGRLVEVGE